MTGQSGRSTSAEPHHRTVLQQQEVDMPNQKNKPKRNPQPKKDKIAIMVEVCVKNAKARRKSLDTKKADNEEWRKQYVASLRSVPQRST